MWYEVGRQENVLLVAVAALIASAIFLLPLKGSSSRYWRVADLAILAVGAFGLFAATFESDDEISNRFLALQYSPEAIKSTWELDVLLPLETSSFAGCHPGNKTAYSPENFDEVEKLKSEICSWVENVRQKYVETQKLSSPVPIPINVIESFPNWIPDWRGVVGFDRSHLESGIKSWNAYASRYVELRARTGGNSLGNLKIVSPYFIALAFAMAIIKVLYERRD
jgi:hypothetical protein